MNPELRRADLGAGNFGVANRPAILALPMGREQHIHHQSNKVSTAYHRAEHGTFRLDSEPSTPQTSWPHRGTFREGASYPSTELLPI